MWPSCYNEALWADRLPRSSTTSTNPSFTHNAPCNRTITLLPSVVHSKYAELYCLHQIVNMRFTYTTACVLAAGSLTSTLALPVNTSTTDRMHSMSTMPVSVNMALAPRQEQQWTPAPSAAASIPPQSTFIYDPPQPSTITPTIPYSSTDVPPATPTSQTQDTQTYTAPQDKSGSRAMLILFGVLGALVSIVLLWAVTAQRNRRRPFSCFGNCTRTRRKTDPEQARPGSTDSDISLVGAWRHYDPRPVSVQLQPGLVLGPQRPQPVRCQDTSRVRDEPEWARGF